MRRTLVLHIAIQLFISRKDRKDEFKGAKKFFAPWRKHLCVKIAKSEHLGYYSYKSFVYLRLLMILHYSRRSSGDLHGSNLIKELKKLDTSAVIRCWGGDKMQQAGGDLVKHYRDLAFMGFWEVIKNIFTILRNLKFCKKDIEQFQPDTLILIDYPGFNLRIAKWAKQKGLRIIYYISPQVWAWKENRVKMMKETIDKMIVILPFEKDYFKNKWSWEVEYVGHPLVEVIESEKLKVKSES